MPLSAMARVLDRCQKTQHAHRKGFASLGKALPLSLETAHDDSDASEEEVKEELPLDASGQKFVDEYVSHVKRLLVVAKREPAVERLVGFIGQFAGLHEKLAAEVLKFLVSVHNAKDKTVRFRVCQMIEVIMTGLEEDAEISDQLWDSLQDALIDRSKDKIVSVRCAAIKAMVRLQNPDDEECPIIKEYVRLATTDSSATVREAAVLAICISEATLPTILQRTRDVSKAVATAAASKVQATIPQGDADVEADPQDQNPSVSKEKEREDEDEDEEDAEDDVEDEDD